MPENKCRRNEIARKSPFTNHEYNNWFREPESSMDIKIGQCSLGTAYAHNSKASLPSLLC